MRVRDEMRAHRLAIACALAVVPAVAIVIAVTRSGGHSAASSSASRAGESQRAACHVTRPNASTAPGEHPSSTSHGGHGLWTQLPLDGVLRITPAAPAAPGDTPGQIYRDGSLGTKFPWWGSRSAAQKLTVRGRRTDGPARRFRFTVGPGSVAHSPHFWPTRLRFTRPGCWHVTARSGQARLAFTVTVQRAHP